MKTTPLFEASTLPFRGMNSALDPTALQDGQWALAQNVRPDAGALMARWPTVDMNATGLPAHFTPLGFWSGLLNGNQWWVIAVWNTGDAIGEIYYSLDGARYLVATQQFGSAYGDTRLTVNQEVSFQVVHENATGVSGAAVNIGASDFLVCQNGKDPARILLPTAVHGSSIVPVSSISPPTSISAVTPLASWYDAWEGGFGPYGHATTGTQTGTHLNVARAESWSYLALGAWGGTATPGTDSIILTWASYSFGELYYGNQLIFACDQYIADHWSKLRVEIIDTVGGTQIISDPSTTNYAAPVLVAWTPSNQYTLTNGGCMVAFNVASIPQANRSHITGLRFTWISTEDVYGSSSYNVNIFGIYASGAAPYGCEFGISYANSAARTESPGVVLQPPQMTQMVYVQESNGTIVTAQLPYTSGLCYDFNIYSIPLPNTPGPVDTAYLYVAYPGSSAFTWAGVTATLSTYATGWSSSPPVPINYSSYYFNADVVPLPDPSRVMPDAYCQSIPTGTSMATGVQRLFVSAGGYWFSELQQPFRFRSVVDVTNQRSGGYVTIQGESIVGWAAIPGQQIGSASVLCFTDKSFYMIGGWNSYGISQPSMIGHIGCAAANTIAVFKQNVYWVDDQFQVVKYLTGAWVMPGMDPVQRIGKRIIDNYTTSVPLSRIGAMVGYSKFDRYYLALTPSGGSSNTVLLVWDETVGVWVVDTLPDSAEYMAGAGFNLFLLGAGGDIWQHEQIGTPGTLSLALNSREMHQPDWSPIHFDSVMLVCDKQAGQQMSVTKTAKPFGEVESSFVDLSTNVVNQVWRYDTRSSSENPDDVESGGDGASVQLALSCPSFACGSKIYFVGLEMGPETAGGPDRQ